MSSTKGPKIAVIGAGSMFFGRQAIKGVMSSEVLRTGTLALVDTHEPTLEKMTRLAGRAKEHSGAPTKIEASTDRREVLAGCDFVVLTFANDGIRYRGIDTEIAARHGVLMCSSDTIGPGGIFRTLREAHEILAVTRDVEELCPDSWVINYINPTTCNGILLMRHAPKLKSFALCDGLHEPHRRRRLLRNIGMLGPDEVNPELESKTVLRLGGINHFTWLWGFEVDGEDCLGKYYDFMRKHAADENDAEHSKRRNNGRYRLALSEIFGAACMCIGHTKEYVPYWQGYTRNPYYIEPITTFDAPARQRQRDGVFDEIVEWNDGKKDMAEFFEKVATDHATDVIEGMWGNLGKRFYINQPNRGAVGNFDDDAFFELLSDVDMKGPRPVAIGEMPRGLKGLTHQVLDTHELTVEAAVTCDRKVLRRAMLTDPIVSSIPDADAIVEDLLEAEREALPEGWFE
ncbi:MAG: family 4 glycosyl hydrolase [Planctomycetota bacterium]|jgi:alpha-galactosidase